MITGKEQNLGERLLDSLGRKNLYETDSKMVGLDYLRSGRKRAMDAIGATILLTFGGAELSGAGALAIVALNRFSPFVRIEGPNGVSRLKLQTMRPGSQKKEAEVLNGGGSLTELKNKGDPRVTKTGRILRATSLDELPTLFDVLQGKMSLVGPKPLTKDEYRFHILPNIQTEPYTSYVRFLTKEAVKYGFLGTYILWGRNRLYFNRVSEDVEYMEKANMTADYRMTMLNAVAVLVYRGK